jgi:WD40 repeat protein
MQKPIYITVFIACLLAVGLRAEETPAVVELKHTTNVYSVAFSHDGKRVVTSCHINVRIWDVETGSATFGRELKKLKGHTEKVLSTAFSPDGKRVITGSGDKTARIWDWESAPPARPAIGNF